MFTECRIIQLQIIIGIAKIKIKAFGQFLFVISQKSLNELCFIRYSFSMSCVDSDVADKMKDRVLLALDKLKVITL